MKKVLLLLVLIAGSAISCEVSQDVKAIRQQLDNMERRLQVSEQVADNLRTELNNADQKINNLQLEKTKLEREKEAMMMRIEELVKELAKSSPRNRLLQ